MSETVSQNAESRVRTPRTVTVLGSTGSVGTQTLDLLSADPARFRVKA